MTRYDWNYTDEIGEISELLWNLLDQPVAIYLRGSSAISSKYKPWDIDLYLISEVVAPSNLISTVATLNETYKDLPELDVTSFVKSEFVGCKVDTLRMLLLIHDGQLVRGVCIKSEINDIPLNAITAKKVKEKMKGYLDQRLQIIEEQLISKEKNREILDYSFKKAAKMIVRAGCFVGIEYDGVFSRNLTICLMNLKKKYPNIADELVYLYDSLGEVNVDPILFMRSINRARSQIYAIEH